MRVSLVFQYLFCIFMSLLYLMWFLVIIWYNTPDGAFCLKKAMLWTFQFLFVSVGIYEVIRVIYKAVTYKNTLPSIDYWVQYMNKDYRKQPEEQRLIDHIRTAMISGDATNVLNNMTMLRYKHNMSPDAILDSIFTDLEGQIWTFFIHFEPIESKEYFTVPDYHNTGDIKLTRCGLRMRLGKYDDTLRTELCTHDWGTK